MSSEPFVVLLGRGLWRNALQLRHNVITRPLCEISTNVIEHAHLHLVLGFFRLRAHVREERGLRKLEKPRIYVWLVRVHIKPDGGKL